MKITTTIDVPDYVYLFYQKVSEHLGDRSAEELMATAVLVYAHFIADEFSKAKETVQS